MCWPRRPKSMSSTPKHNVSTSLGVTTALRKDTVSLRSRRKWWSLFGIGILCVLSSSESIRIGIPVPACTCLCPHPSPSKYIESQHMQPSVYDAILPNILLTLSVSTEPNASFFRSSRLTRSSRPTDASGTPRRRFVLDWPREAEICAPAANLSSGPIVSLGPKPIGSRDRPQQIEGYSLLRKRMQRWTVVGTPALQRLHQSIRIVSRVKTHICKSLIGDAKPPVGEVGGIRQRHISFVERLQNP
jgi:hypothetical protein